MGEDVGGSCSRAVWAAMGGEAVAMDPDAAAGAQTGSGLRLPGGKRYERWLPLGAMRQARMWCCLQRLSSLALLPVARRAVGQLKTGPFPLE